MKQVISVSAVVPTRNRSQPLARMLAGLRQQSALPAELIVVDASDDTETKRIVDQHSASIPIGCTALWTKAKHTGAAVQRNQGVAAASQPFILFCDDDVVFEPECVMRLWDALARDIELGGVNATIVNQQYHPPGLVSRVMFTLMNGRAASTFAGRAIGPAVNLLPEDREDLPEVVPVDWMNLGCTIYRREALPDPPFLIRFGGYSLMEDLALSLEVGKNWKLANVRTARLFHDSQSGDYKSDPRALSSMELTNRHHVMTAIMGKRSLADYARLGLWELFSLVSTLQDKKGRKRLPAAIAGKWDGLRQIISARGP